MTAVNWNRLVNTAFILGGGHGYGGGIAELEFESGKKRAFLRNGYIPKQYPSVSLALDNAAPVAEGRENTEFKQFDSWFRVALRYGTLPFYAPRLGGSAGDTGVYRFTPGSLSYEGTGAIVTASFSLEEEAYYEAPPEKTAAYLVFEGGAYFGDEAGNIFTA